MTQKQHRAERCGQRRRVERDRATARRWRPVEYERSAPRITGDEDDGGGATAVQGVADEATACLALTQKQQQAERYGQRRGSNATGPRCVLGDRSSTAGPCRGARAAGTMAEGRWRKGDGGARQAERYGQRQGSNATGPRRGGGDRSSTAGPCSGARAVGTMAEGRWRRGALPRKQQKARGVDAEATAGGALRSTPEDRTRPGHGASAATGRIRQVSAADHERRAMASER